MKIRQYKDGSIEYDVPDNEALDFVRQLMHGNNETPQQEPEQELEREEEPEQQVDWPGDLLEMMDQSMNAGGSFQATVNERIAERQEPRYAHDPNCNTSHIPGPEPCPQPKPEVDKSSRYYKVNRLKNSRVMAATYDYISRHVRGRTTDQICEQFHIMKTTAWSRTESLRKDGLIRSPKRPGGPWTITENVPGIDFEERRTPSPLEMPRHRAV